jgi:hypothetical protein
MIWCRWSEPWCICVLQVSNLPLSLRLFYWTSALFHNCSIFCFSILTLYTWGGSCVKYSIKISQLNGEIRPIIINTGIKLLSFYKTIQNIVGLVHFFKQSIWHFRVQNIPVMSPDFVGSVPLLFMFLPVKWQIIGQCLRLIIEFCHRHLP